MVDDRHPALAQLGAGSLVVTHRLAPAVRLAVVAGIAFPAVVGLLAGAVTDAGSRTDPKFYELVSQIVPVFFLAIFVEYFAPSRRAHRSRARTLVVLGDVMLVESLALYAVAAQAASTFLTVTCAVALTSQVVDLAAVHAARDAPAVPERVAPRSPARREGT